MRRAAFVLLILIVLPSAAIADKRVALVIGNGDYAKVGKLPNPTSDANAVGTMLRAAKFELVEIKKDLGVAALRRALRDFSDHVRDADIAMVFYAGHGIEVNGTNYLIPIDAALERDLDVEDETVSLDRVTQILDPAKRLRLVILDACRDNPFVRSMKRTVSGRSIGRGLAKVDVQTSDTLIAFAAKAGSTAEDGNGANSPYTNALVKHLTTPGLDLRLALGRVRDEVLANTGKRQEPFVYGSLGGSEIALVPTEKAAPPLAIPPALSEAAQAWVHVKDTTNQSIVQAFIKEFGDTVYGALAQGRLEELKRQQVAIVQPVPDQAPQADRARITSQPKRGAPRKEFPKRDRTREFLRGRTSGDFNFWRRYPRTGRRIPFEAWSNSGQNGMGLPRSISMPRAPIRSARSPVFWRARGYCRPRTTPRQRSTCSRRRKCLIGPPTSCATIVR